MLQAERRGVDRFAFGRPYFGEAQNIRAQFLDFVDQQLAAGLVAVKTDQAMFAIDEDHAVAQVTDLLGGLLRRSAVVVLAQQIEQFRVALAQRIGVAQGKAQSAAILDYALQMGQIDGRVQSDSAEIFVIDKNFTAGHRQQAFDGSLIVAPRGDQFTSHGG